MAEIYGRTIKYTTPCLFLLHFFVLSNGERHDICTPSQTPNSHIYCTGRLLDSTAQCMNESGRYFGNDSKAFVDRPLKVSPVFDEPSPHADELMKAFDKAFPVGSKIICSKLVTFVNNYMDKPGGELEKCTPKGWRPRPQRLLKINDKNCKEFALSVNGIWKDLCRKVPERVKQNASMHSLIYVPNEFIAPGGRFREYYYWDTFWIIKGLLVSGMHETAKGQIGNLVQMVERFGFVPNGGRVYYMRRSQPPFLNLMVYHYFLETGDAEFVKKVFPTLDKEFNFWMSNCSLQLSLPGEAEKKHTVFQYKTLANQPRPESYKEDIKLAENLTLKEDKEKLWQNVASTAMSGIDFSTRWVRDRTNFSSIETTRIVPVDLNAIMCRNMELLALFAKMTGNTTREKYYRDMRYTFKDTMKAVFFNDTKKAWFDHWLDYKDQKTEYFASSVVPIYANCYEYLDTRIVKGVYNFMKEEGAMSFTNGVPSSMKSVPWGQWDFPYVWPPQMHMIVEAFRTADDAELQEVAFQLAERYVNANYKAFEESKQSPQCANGCMYEKLNVSDPTPGTNEQGEYPTQLGFGWTNGATLSLIDAYRNRIVCTNGDVQMDIACGSSACVIMSVMAIVVLNYFQS